MMLGMFRLHDRLDNRRSLATPVDNWCFVQKVTKSRRLEVGRSGSLGAVAFKQKRSAAGSVSLGEVQFTPVAARRLQPFAARRLKIKILLPMM